MRCRETFGHAAYRRHFRATAWISAGIALACSSSPLDPPPGAQSVAGGASGAAGSTHDATLLAPGGPLGVGDIAVKGTGGANSSGGAGTGGTSGMATTSSAGSGGGPLTSVSCGDGIRDATFGTDEECDDGPGANPDLCTDACQVSDALAVRGTGAGATRYLGEGRHPVAVGTHGFGVVFVEPDPEPPVIGLSVFDGAGDPRSRIDVGAGSSPVLFASPTVTALDDGSYVAVWTDQGGDGDGLGIALRRVTPETVSGSAPPASGLDADATLSPLQFASGDRPFSQYDADLLRVGDELVVAWTDSSDASTGPDVRYRTFDATGSSANQLRAVGEEQTLSDGPDFEGNVALAPFGATWAAAFRATGGVEETIEVVVPSEGLAWSIGPHPPGAPEDRPALAELDADHLLVLFAVGTDPESTGIANVSRLHAAVLARTSFTPVAELDLPPLDPAYQALTVAQSHPSLVRAGDVLVAAYRASSLVADVAAENVFLQTLSWESDVLSVLIEGRIPRLPEGMLGDQRFPALAVGPRQQGTAGLPEPAPLGALAIAWDDYGATVDPAQGQPDVLVQHWPLPVVRIDGCTVATPCGSGEGDCDDDTECQSGLVCGLNRGAQFTLAPDDGVCVPPHCVDGVQNSTETGKDCGGECGSCLCGNGVVDSLLGETCDDANAVNTDACPSTCLVATCGDGYVRTGVEQCDPPGATCTSTCQLTPCGYLPGDRTCASGEYCDDDGVCKTRPCNLTDPFISLTSVFDDTVRASSITFSADKLSAYVGVGYGVGAGAGYDIKVATRATPTSPFGSFSAVAGIPTTAWEEDPWLSNDGLQLYYSTTNTSNGDPDIMRVTRSTPTGTFGNVTSISLNQIKFDLDPYFAPGQATFFFASDRTAAGLDLWSSTYSGGTFGTPVALTNLNVANARDSDPVVSRDGLRIYFKSRRVAVSHPNVNADGDGDIYMADRSSTSVDFPAPTMINILNTSGIDFPVGVSADGCSLFVGSNRHVGTSDIENYRLYEAKRGTPPQNVTITMKVYGNAGDSVGTPFNCAAGGTCTVTQAYGTYANPVFASRGAYWSGGCDARGSPGLSSDGVVMFMTDPVCTVQFP